MYQMLPHTIALSQIAGLSPYNPRQDTDSDVTTLAATIRARGLVHPIVVHYENIADGVERFVVLDGGRRWRAVHANQTDPADDPIINVMLASGAESELRELATAVSITQKPLHPVEEFEAFSDLETSGLSVADIARDFAQTEKQVRQRLALGRLSPRVRALWKEGVINRDTAEAFTVGTIEAQEAFIDARQDETIDQYSAYAIRKALRSDALDPLSRVAKFFVADASRLGAYADRGGRMDNDLFSVEAPVLLDAAIAHKVCDQLLLAEAERVMDAEGWGGASLEDDDNNEEPNDYTHDYGDEEERLVELNTAYDKDDTVIERELQAEIDAIEARAIVRAIPASERATLGVRAELTYNGEIEIVRAVPLAIRREPRDDDAGEANPPLDVEGRAQSERGGVGQHAPAPPLSTPPEKIGKQLRAVVDETLTEALRAVTQRNLSIAMVFSVAALGCSYGRAGVGLSDPNGYWKTDPRTPILRNIANERFEKALLLCLNATTDELAVAFAELVARSIDMTKAEPQSGLILAATAAKMSDMRGALCEAMDYAEYFTAATKDAAVEAIREMDGEAAANDAGKLKKADLVARAALLAHHKQWLPTDFNIACAAPAKEKPPKKRAPKPTDTRSTAPAMQDAIAADEDAPQTPAAIDKATIAKFLYERTVFASDGRIKASELHDAFDAWRADDASIAALEAGAFARALAANAIDKTRFNTGVHYTGLALREHVDAKRKG